MYEGREHYVSAPVSLVVAEMRFGHEPLLASESGINDLLGRLRDAFPLMAREDVETLTMLPGSPEQHRRSRWRASASDRRTSVILSEDSVVLETTNYKDGYDGLEERLRAACDALASPLDRARVWRYGLRYLDEIRLPGTVTKPEDWSAWIAPHLTSAINLAGGADVVGYHGDIAWRTGSDRAVTMRWGTFDQGTVLAKDLPLVRDSNSEGPIFVLDIDSYQQPETPVKFSAEGTLTTFRELHEPTGRAFQTCLTPSLREQFRRERG